MLGRLLVVYSAEEQPSFPDVMLALVQRTIAGLQ
jgi:hypothetical protein